MLTIFTSTDYSDLGQFPVSVGQMRGVRSGLEPESKSLWDEESLKLYQHWETIHGFLNELMWYLEHLKMYNSSLLSLAYLASCSLLLWCHAKEATWAKRCSHWQRGRKVKRLMTISWAFIINPNKSAACAERCESTERFGAAQEPKSPHPGVSPLQPAQSRAVPWRTWLVFTYDP